MGLRFCKNHGALSDRWAMSVSRGYQITVSVCRWCDPPLKLNLSRRGEAVSSGTSIV
jgi:hypothetical protein